MNWLAPFPVIVPAADKAHLVASRSYLTYGKSELQDKLDRNPYSYLHIINPAGTKKASERRGSDGFFRLVKDRYDSFCESGWLQKSAEEVLVIYRQSGPDHECTGIVGALSIDGIQAGRLKLHEQTLDKRERLFERYLKVVECHAEPILCMFPDGESAGNKMRNAIQKWTQSQPPQLDFSTTDRIRHTAWILDSAISKDLSEEFEAIKDIYLADGHHRVASSLRLAEKFPGQKAKQQVLSYVVPESEIKIRGFHREVCESNWNASDWERAFSEHASSFDWQRVTSHDSAPNQLGIIQVHSSTGNWILRRKDFDKDQVDAEALQQTLFERSLGIADARNDERLTYIPGTKTTDELAMYVQRNPGAVLFELAPVSTEQIKATADRGAFLPPKSTWVEPKLRSGLFIHEIR
ncbi:MAG: DUF1015 family protein [Flavobacteriales bacterium]